MDFKQRLHATVRAIRPVLEEPGVLVVGSEVPNLLRLAEPAPIVISRDVDVGVPITAHDAVKRRLAEVRGLRPSANEPSVWVPEGDLLEVNFLGLDERLRDVAETYVLEDPDLPLLVFGPLGILRPGPSVEVDGVRVRLPRTAGLLLEKLLTDRSGEKGDRDLLVAVGLLVAASEADLAEAEDGYAALAGEMRHEVRANLAVLSLAEPREGMPDPRPERARVAALLRRLEAREGRP